MIFKLTIYHRILGKQALWMFFKYGEEFFWRIGDIISKYSAAIELPITYVSSKKEHEIC